MRRGEERRGEERREEKRREEKRKIENGNIADRSHENSEGKKDGKGVRGGTGES